MKDNAQVLLSEIKELVGKLERGSLYDTGTISRLESAASKLREAADKMIEDRHDKRRIFQTASHE